MSSKVLRYEVHAGVATLTLNRPEKRNALSGELVSALHEALTRAGADEEVRVVAITGAGEDFCSGADLADLERISGMSAEENLADARSLGAVFVSMRRLPKPVVAVVRGRALAGGCGLATACDLVLAHEGAGFGYPEVYLGFVPAMVMAVLRRKVTEGLAFELVTRGHRIDAEEARRVGLVNAVFPGTSFESDVDEYLAELAAKPASALALTKELLYGLDDLDFEAGIERGAQVNVQARQTEACRDGLRRFLDRSGR